MLVSWNEKHKEKNTFLNSSNNKEKNISKSIIVNIKLMFFILLEYIDDSYHTIKNKYNSKSYKEFYKYMDKFISKKYNGQKYIWNSYKLITNNKIIENHFFITKNFIERSNRALKENLIYQKSSFINFRNFLLNANIYFENK